MKFHFFNPKMLKKLFASRCTFFSTTSVVGISIYYHGFYQQSHLIQSDHAHNFLKSLYEENHANNPENACSKIGIIVFDGVCNICNNGIKFVDRFEKKKHGNKLYIAWAQNEDTTKPLLKSLDISDESIHERFAFIEYDVHRNGVRLYRASSAALQTCTYLKFPLNLGIVGIVFPQMFGDFVYDVIASNRYEWFGKTEECQVDVARSVITRFIHDVDP